MLDIELYRMSESLAKQGMRTWRYSQVHRLDVFERFGFPVRVSNIGELEQIVGTMHNNDRYEGLQTELGGFDEADLHLFVGALADYHEFHAKTFPREQVAVPLAEMIAHLAIYKMVGAYNPNFKRVLEIGPGNGLLSFFMRRHAQLSNYSQVEACESYYLLQSLINDHLFGSGFQERAMPQDLERASACFSGSGDVQVTQATRKAELNYSLPFRGEKVCYHYPWWRIGELAEADVRFDVVTSNANLLEFTPEALNDYAHLMHDVLADDGILYVQCFGARVNGNVNTALKKLFSAGFRAMLLVPDGGVLEDGDRSLKKALSLGNGVFVRSGHERFDDLPGPGGLALDEDSAVPTIAWDCPEVSRMCFGPSAGRERYEEADILNFVAREVMDRLEDGLAPMRGTTGCSGSGRSEPPTLGFRHA